MQGYAKEVSALSLAQVKGVISLSEHGPKKRESEYMDHSSSHAIALQNSGYAIKRLQVVIDLSVLCFALTLAYLLRFDFVLSHHMADKLAAQL